MAKKHATRNSRPDRAKLTAQDAGAVEIDVSTVEELKRRAQTLALGEPQPAPVELASFVDKVRGLPSQATALEAIRQLGNLLGEMAVPLLEDLAMGHDSAVEAESARELGTLKSVSAVSALGHVAEAALDRDVRKEARRSLFKLRSAGMDVDAILRPEKRELEPKKAEQRVPVLWRAFASTYDAVGDRVIIVAVEKPFGGIESCIAIVNEIKGIIAYGSHDTNKRKWEREEIQQAQEYWKPMRIIDIPTDYAKHLLKAAYQKNRAIGEQVPPEFNRLRAVLTTPEREYERALVFEEVNSLEVKWDPQLIEESAQLFELPEVGPWHLPLEKMAEFVDEIQHITSGQIALPEWVQKERATEVLKRALEKLLPPEERDRYRRQLEETAYVFLRTERPRLARVALAAAQAMEGADAAKLGEQPFVMALVGNSMARSVVNEARQPDETSTRSGLIVDRDEISRFIESQHNSTPGT